MFASALVNLYTGDIEVDAAYRDPVAAGVPALQPPHDTGNSNRNALLRDPDGNLVEIVARRAQPGQARRGSAGREVTRTAEGGRGRRPWPR